MTRSVLLLLQLLQHSAAFTLLQHTNTLHTALRASDDAIDASSPDAFLAGLMNRVDELKARQLELRSLYWMRRSQTNNSRSARRTRPSAR